jgi:hypothetical protein
VPTEDLAVVVLTNSNGNGVGPAEDLLIRAILPKWKGIPDPPEPDPPPFKPTPELVGTWIGYVHTYAGDRPLSLQFLADGHVLFQIGDQVASVVNKARWDEGSFRGTARGELNTPDLQRHEPYGLDLNLQVRGTELTGSVTATGIVIDVGSPHHFALSHWTQLRKMSR